MNTDTVIRIYGESERSQNFSKFAKDGQLFFVSGSFHFWFCSVLLASSEIGSSMNRKFQ